MHAMQFPCVCWPYYSIYCTWKYECALGSFSTILICLLQPSSPNAAHQNELAYDLEVLVEIQEEDGKGNFAHVSTDKDCFKLRIGSRKKLVVTVSQNSKHHVSLEKYVMHSVVPCTLYIFCTCTYTYPYRRN